MGLLWKTSAQVELTARRFTPAGLLLGPMEIGRGNAVGSILLTWAVVR